MNKLCYRVEHTMRCKSGKLLPVVWYGPAINDGFARRYAAKWFYESYKIETISFVGVHFWNGEAWEIVKPAVEQ